MDLLVAAFLGILQGLTEFLPVSSSGHLVLAQSLIPSFSQPGVLFEAVLHAGTLLAIVYYFRKRILKIDPNYLKILFIGTIPAAFMGLFFKDFFEALFESTKVVGVALIATGVINLLTDRNRAKSKNITVLDSLLIGIAQAIAIIPGVSRSGATIFTSTKRGVDRQKSAEFSFLLSVPAVIGANLLQFTSYSSNAGHSLSIYLVGFTFAFLSGSFAIKTVIAALKNKKFSIFAYYCIVIGIIALIF